MCTGRRGNVRESLASVQGYIWHKLAGMQLDKWTVKENLALYTPYFLE